MHTIMPKLDYLEIASEITEWIERNFGYFVNKNSDKDKIIQDFSHQLERLPLESMSYLQQAKNNFYDKGLSRPPSPVEFIAELKTILNKQQNQETVKIMRFNKVSFLMSHLFKMKTDSKKIKYINLLAEKGKLKQFLDNRSIATMEIEAILKRNNFSDEKIKELAKEC